MSPTEIPYKYWLDKQKISAGSKLFSKFLLVSTYLLDACPESVTACHYSTTLGPWSNGPLSRGSWVGSVDDDTHDSSNVVWRGPRGGGIQRGGRLKGLCRGGLEGRHLPAVYLVPRQLHRTPGLSRKCELLYLCPVLPPPSPDYCDHHQSAINVLSCPPIYCRDSRVSHQSVLFDYIYWQGFVMCGSFV